VARVVWRLRIQRGKCWASVGTVAAVIAEGARESDDVEAKAGVEK